MTAKFTHRFPLELIFWTIALVTLYRISPDESSHFRLCPLHQLGITWCPGCGLGRAISLLMHSHWQAIGKCII